jgi:3-hydroxyacyl-[acyl-carrier-protein] dehydratase
MELNNAVLVNEEEITLLIPHRVPFVMVDQLLHNDEKITISSFVVKSDNLFLENDVLTEPALIENIAQTAALRVGYPIYQAIKEGKDLKAHLGFIAAITDLRVYDLPPLGAELQTKVLFEKEVMDIFLVSGGVYYLGKCLAECRMKIFAKRK